MRVPFGNFVPFVIPENAEMDDEKLLFLSDIVPTAYWSVINGDFKAVRSAHSIWQPRWSAKGGPFR